MEAILARPLWHKRSVHYAGIGGVEKKNKPECWRFSIRSRLFACHQVTLMKAAAMDDPGLEEGHALTTSAETDISFFKMALSHLRSDPHAKRFSAFISETC